MNARLLCVVNLLLVANLSAEQTTYEWPGMTAYDVVVCARLVLDAQFVERREEDGERKTIWVHDARGWKKPNGFYGLKINGEVVDEGSIWVFYRDRSMNLKALFSYGSSTIDPAHNFQDPNPH